MTAHERMGSWKSAPTGAAWWVVNHPDLRPDEHGTGHILFSPDQAKALALILLQQADAASSEVVHPVQ